MKQKKYFLPILLLLVLFISSCAGIPQEYFEEDNIEPVAYYSVVDRKIINDIYEDETYMPLSQANIDLHHQIWNRTLEIIPDEYEHYIKYFRISSDGIENILAYVEPDGDETKTDTSSWTLAVDLVDVIDRMGEVKREEMDETLIHEFAHILSLNSNETDPVVTENPDDLSWMDEWDFNKSYRMYDAIAKDNSYINRFFQKFWGEDQLREWFELENDTAFNRLSIKYYTDFVSDYAMTNPEEDFAESFTHFITKEKPEGITISHRKILFFYEIPEMLKIRDEIRMVLPQENN